MTTLLDGLVKPGLVTTVMGGAYGSEGKGEVVAWLASRYKPGIVVRTGGPNAGHTMTLTRPYSNRSGPNEIECGEETGTFKMRQIPAAWHAPGTRLVIGPGAIFSPEVFEKELEMVNAWQPGAVGERRPVYLDSRATILTHDHAAQEQGEKLQTLLGSTQEGIGAARSERVWRKADTAKDWWAAQCKGGWGNPVPGLVVTDTTSTPERGPDVIQGSGGTLIESTQGFGLSLHAAGTYPYCTSADITPGQILNDAGYSSRVDHRVLVVLRTMPIRVAGNSGPLHNEISWSALHAQNPLIPAEGERTTVTNKVRRIGESMDEGATRYMAEQVRPDGIVITFMDYLFPETAQATRWSQIDDYNVKRYIGLIEHWCQAPVVAVSTGPGRIIARED